MAAREEARRIRSLLRCYHFKEDINKKALAAKSKEHDELVAHIVRIFRNMVGSECREESPSVERGVADAVLRCGDKIYVLEVKSYPFAEIDEETYCQKGFARSYIADFEQAVLYGEKIGERFKSSEVIPVLVYRGLPVEGLENTPLFIFIDVEAVRGESVATTTSAELAYKPGPECARCENAECPIRDKMRKYLAQGTAQSRAADAEGAYQELFKTEWCLARHGTRCVKCGPLYIALSQTTLHRDDLPLAEEHIHYVITSQNAPQIAHQLKAQKLLIEKRCDQYRTPLQKIRIDSSRCCVVVSGATRNDFLIMLEYISLLNSLRRRGVKVDAQKLLNGPEKCYRTFHGEVARLIRNISALPGDRRTFEAYYLPIIIDHIGSRNIQVNQVINHFPNSLWNKNLIDKLVSNLFDEKGQLVTNISGFQNEAIKKIAGSLTAWLEGSSNKSPFVILTAPPGSGKTLVFLIVAIAIALRGRKAVIMYPSKKLALQQVQQIYYILEALNRQGANISLAVLDGDSKRCNKRPQGGVRALRCDGGNGSLEYQNGQYICRSNQAASQVSWFTDCEDGALSSSIIVTNPYKLSSMLMRSDDNAKELADRLALLVVDEVHTMLEPQHLDFFTALLHRLFLLGNVEKYPAIILSSATVTSSGLPLAGEITSGAGITFRSVGAVERIEPPDPRVVKEFTESLANTLLGERLAQEYTVESVDYYSILGGVQDSSNTGAIAKLTAPMVVFTNPAESPSGTVQEAVVSLLIASGARRSLSAKMLSNFSSVIFFDSKESLSEVEAYVRNRLILQEGSPSDKTVTKPFVMDLINSSTASYGLNLIGNILSSGRLAELEDFSHLTLFCTSLAELNDAYKFAQNAYNSGSSAAGWPPCYDKAISITRDIIADIKNNIRNVQNRHTLLVHHADLSDNVRYSIEEKLEQPGAWSVVLSTSTLELGVNLTGVGVVGQLGLPRLAENVIQRFGRGGRDRSVLYTAVGILFAKHTGEDVALIDEDYAVARLFAFKRTPILPRNENRIISIEQLIAYTTIKALGGFRNSNAMNYALNVVNKSLQFLVSNTNKASQLYPVLHTRLQAMFRAPQALGSSGGSPPYRLITDFINEINQYINNIKNNLQNINNSCNLYKNLSNIISIYATDPLKYSWELYFALNNVLSQLNSSSSLGCFNNTDLYNLVRDSVRDALRAIKELILQYFPRAPNYRRRMLREMLLQLSFVPPMPDPRIIEYSLDHYTVESRGIRKRSRELREAYLRSAPLKTDRYEGV